jgi:hypothetical protein
VRAKPVLMEFDAILARAAETLKQKPLRASLTPSEIARMAEYHYAWTLANHDQGLQLGPATEAEGRSASLTACSPRRMGKNSQCGTSLFQNMACLAGRWRTLRTSSH